MTDPRVRVAGRIEDMDGMPVYLGVDYDTVTIHAGVFMPGGGIRLESSQAEDFARACNAACWEAARQATRLTGAQRAELKAAAGEMCLADCGAPVHDKTCSPQPAERNRSQ
jgi:hypothetical protein